MRFPPPNSDSADAVRIGVVGAGLWGQNVIRNLFELPQADLGAVCDVRHEALRKVLTRWPSVGITRDFEDLLSDSSLDAIAIVTPISTHFELAAAALDAGKHVFVEKPLAGSSAECAELIRRADASQLTLMPGHTFLYSPAVRVVRDLVRAGELGRIHFISMSRLNLGIHQPDVSVIWDLAPHDISMLRFWLDEWPTEVAAISRGCVIPETPDVAFINFAFASGAIANVEVAWLAPTKLRRTVIVGSQKMVLYDDTAKEPVRVFDSGVTQLEPQTFGEFHMSYRTGDIVSPPVDATEPLYLELADFCRCIRESRRPVASPELGLDVVRVVEAIEEAIASGGPAVVEERVVA